MRIPSIVIAIILSLNLFPLSSYGQVQTPATINHQFMADKIKVKININDKCYLYAHKFKLSNQDDEEITPLTALPEGDTWRQNFVFYLPLDKEITIAYQGCNEKGFCFMPQKYSMVNPQNSMSTTEHIIATLKNKSIASTLLIFFGFGLLLSFSPCLLPMAPIVATILIGEYKHSRKRAMLLVSCYIVSMALCYTLAGVVAGSFGSYWQAQLQHPITLGLFAIVVLLLALSQFNIIKLHLPRFLTDFFHKLERKQKSGSYIGAVVMGILSSLIASPCVTPALVGALTYISQTGNSAIGGLALFMLGIGMGLPLWLIAIAGAKYLPRSGKIMHTAKYITGIMLLLFAGSLFMRIIPNITLAQPSGKFTTISSMEQLNKALIKAKQQNRYTIVDVSATWCVNCHTIEEEVFQDKEVIKQLKNWQLLQIDLTTPTDDKTALQNKLTIIGPPTIIFFAPNGAELASKRIVGPISKEGFLQQIHAISK